MDTGNLIATGGLLCSILAVFLHTRERLTVVETKMEQLATVPEKVHEIACTVARIEGKLNG